MNSDLTMAADTGRDGFGPAAHHTARLGRLQGQGDSEPEAMADLAAQLAAMAGRRQETVFGWDERTGTLLVAVTDMLYGGHHEYWLHLGGGAPRLGAALAVCHEPLETAFAGDMARLTGGVAAAGGPDD
jgi:hypothetical protein